MGIHYVNGDLVGDGKLDAARPEALMYEPIPAFYALHVWAWRDNPHGVFVDWNPRVSCAEHRAGAATQTSAVHDARH